MRSLFDPRRELRINRKLLVKYLNILLQTPWHSSDNFPIDEASRIPDGAINRRGGGFLHVRGDSVKLYLGKIVRNWVISLQIILLQQSSAVLRSKIVNRALNILVPVLLDIHNDALDRGEHLALNEDEIKQALKETLENFDSRAFLDAIANASIVDLEKIDVKVALTRRGIREFWDYGPFNYSIKNMKTIHGFRQNYVFIDAIYSGAKNFLHILDLQTDPQIVTEFLTTELALKTRQWQITFDRTKPIINMSQVAAQVLLYLLLNYIFVALAGNKIGFALVAINSFYFLLARYNANNFRREAKPEYKIKSEVNYQHQQDAALERIYACVNLQAVKIRYLENNKKLTILKAKPAQSSRSIFSKPPSSTNVESIKVQKVVKDKSEKKPAQTKERRGLEGANHKRLHSIDWTDRRLPRFTPSNVADPTRPFPVEINGIPYGRAFCMFPATVVSRLKEYGIENLIDVANRSGASRGDQGVVQSGDCYATHDGIFEAVAKLKFISSRKSEHSKGSVRVYMREGGKGPNGELLLIADGLQTDHQFSNS
jgi:hypothetical protein